MIIRKKVFLAHWYYAASDPTVGPRYDSWKVWKKIISTLLWWKEAAQRQVNMRLSCHDRAGAPPMHRNGQPGRPARPDCPEGRGLWQCRSRESPGLQRPSLQMNHSIGTRKVSSEARGPGLVQGTEVSDLNRVLDGGVISYYFIPFHSISLTLWNETENYEIVWNENSEIWNSMKWSYEMAMKWLWNGHEMSMKWRWNGYEMAMKWVWNGNEMAMK